MIFSRTSDKKDVPGLQAFIDYYAAIPKIDGDYTNSPYKFWDYYIACRLIQLKTEYSVNILNVRQTNKPDLVFQNICRDRGWKYEVTEFGDFLDRQIRGNRYDMVCLFGELEHTKEYRPLQIIAKVSRHVDLGGYLLITTDEITTAKNKQNVITTDDLLMLSTVLEKSGYEFVSDETDLVDYKDDLNLVHSLAMKRVGK